MLSALNELLGFNTTLNYCHDSSWVSLLQTSLVLAAPLISALFILLIIFPLMRLKIGSDHRKAVSYIFNSKIILFNLVFFTDCPRSRSFSSTCYLLTSYYKFNILKYFCLSCGEKILCYWTSTSTVSRVVWFSSGICRSADFYFIFWTLSLLPMHCHRLLKSICQRNGRFGKRVHLFKLSAQNCSFLLVFTYQDHCAFHLMPAGVCIEVLIEISS